MNPALFINSPAGQCNLTRQGYYAYIPNPLPPQLDLDWELAVLLSDANACLGELSGAGRLLPNPHLLIQPYIRREAVLSSRIENTQAGLSDLFFFEADESEQPQVADVREVANYVRALEYGLKRVKELPLSGRLIREIHKILMKDARGGHAYNTPGEFRKSQNWIGPPGCTLTDATFVPPPVDEMPNLLSAWEKYLNNAAKEPILIQCALMHYQFEAIHPFIDGNGRVGRMLITFMLCTRNALSQPLLYLSAFFERYRDEYYRILLSVSQKGDWRRWIEFFLRGIITQSKEALDDANAILDLHAEFTSTVQTGKAPHAARRIVDHLFTNPVISITRLSQAWNMSFLTVHRGVQYLEKAGILKEITGQKRNRFFISQKLFDLLT